MAKTYIDFQPSDTAPFQFQAVLDGVQYNITVTYNIFGQRYWLNIYTAQGQLGATRPMIGSPQAYDISITQGIFATPLIYRADNKQFEIGSA